MPRINTLGVLTSGGDAPGMNAAIRAVVRTAKYYDMKVMGIRKGFEGLIHGDIFEMSARDVSDIMHRGGTILQTARSTEFKQIEGVRRAVSTSKYFGIEGIVVIGGDGSFRGARDLCTEGLPAVGIPGTIDNDISCTEYSIGFDTAINTAKEAVDKIRDTATSHERCNIIKVMGRASGNIAINVGIATGAEAVLIPEKEIDFTRDIAEPISLGKKRNKKHFIIILAEGVADSGDLEKRIEAEVGLETRTTILGYVQRGGSPTVVDRVFASQMGSYAVELLRDGIGNRIIGVKGGRIYDIDIYEGLDMPKIIRDDLIELSKILSI
ncbi:MAG: 6-phosphofructokinase [Firmicutes bacterium ADurb.Bin193]|nr:MAG: 6-phosphofructokinase [Firmicutes bacterium ADurb.Bin193]